MTEGYVDTVHGIDEWVHQEFRAEFGGVHENVWSRNGLTFDTQAEAASYAGSLLMRWGGADIARVVPADHPAHEQVDLEDERIVANWRT